MKSTFLTTLALTPLALLATEKAKPAKPNIIIILADDLGYGDVGCYNAESKVATPNLDRLARQGMRFTDAHSPSTVSTPSRYSLLTGRMAFRIPYKGVFAGVGGPCLIKEDQMTLPQMLRNQGYATAMTGKWHVGLSFFDKDGQRITQGGVEGVKMIDYSRAIPDSPVHRGFDRFFGTACCPATDFLYAFIDGDRIPVPPTGMLDKPKLPKHPYANDNRDGMIAPGYDLEKLDQVFLQKSLQFLDEHAKGHPEKPFFLFHSMNAVHLPSFASKRFQGSTKAGPHGDFIKELDYIVGELMKALERLGMADNTVVMVSSDNGPETTSVIHMRADYGHDGARPWRGMKRDQWEGGHRVPFIVRWPGKIASGSTSDQTVCLTDIMATCAAITGAALPDNAAEDSYDLLPLLLGKAGGDMVRPYTLHQTISLALAIRKGPWKYLDHRGSGGNNYNNPSLKPFVLTDNAPDAPGQLYNLESDPGETVNLYFKHPEIVQELKALLESSKAQRLWVVDQDWKSMMTIAERKRDIQGNLLPLQSYDETIRRGMDFLLKDHLKWFKGLPSTLLDEKGQQQPPWVYYSNLQQDGTPFAKSVDRFVSYPAFHHALAIRTFLAYWSYSGDNTSLREAIRLADWNIAHSTPADWAYGRLPYSTFQEGKPGGFRDKTGLMPDKAAIMALAYLRLHEATREARFLQAAEAIGMTLSKRQRPNGTWPFRVDPKTETVIEDYTSSVIYAIMLFETLDRLNGDHHYRACRDLAWNWLLNGPIRNKDFRGFYEDIADQPANRTNYDCLDAIRYLLAHRTDTNGYLDLARELNAWIEKVFLEKIQGFEPAEGIREQLECNVVMGIHSLNWASMLLELSKATGDEKMRQRATQTANYITYYLQPDNRIVVGFTYEQWWYSCHMGPILYLLDFVMK